MNCKSLEQLINVFKKIGKSSVFIPLYQSIAIIISDRLVILVKLDYHGYHLLPWLKILRSINRIVNVQFRLLSVIIEYYQLIKIKYKLSKIMNNQAIITANILC